MGIILEGTLRILPYPEVETVHAIGFKDYLTALDALRKIMQSELRPAVVRLYDEVRSRLQQLSIPNSEITPACMLTFAGVRIS